MSSDRASSLLKRFKGNAYRNGFGCLSEAGGIAKELGKRVLLVSDSFPGSASFTNIIRESVAREGLELLAVIDGAAPNAPREDLSRMAGSLIKFQPDVVISFGGGSTIDAVKSAIVLMTLGGAIDNYFGTGLVSAALAKAGKHLTPHIAIQTAASSGAHLTKYSNITDLATGQKKLVVDDAIVPVRAIFDYAVTLTAPRSLTVDGAVDGMAHCLEVLYGAVGKPTYPLVEEVALTGIRMIMQALPRVLANGGDREGREALGLATDLGGYAIMLGGTNGAHLTSFSLIDILSHGRACAILNPYYTVFFAPAIEQPLGAVAAICAEMGCAMPEIEHASGRELGLAVARGLIAFEKAVGLPATLAEVPGFGPDHIARALAAAKRPELRMKLENMPVPLTSEMVDDYMGPILSAARSGDLESIRTL